MQKQLNFTMADIAGWQEAGQHITKAHPELFDAEADRAVASYDLHPAVTEKIVKSRDVETLAHLKSSEGFKDREALHNVRDDKSRSLMEYDRIAGRVARQGDFRKPVAQRRQEDEYLLQRREDIRAGRRWR